MPCRLNQAVRLLRDNERARLKRFDLGVDHPDVLPTCLFGWACIIGGTDDAWEQLFLRWDAVAAGREAVSVARGHGPWLVDQRGGLVMEPSPSRGADREGEPAVKDSKKAKPKKKGGWWAA